MIIPLQATQDMMKQSKEFRNNTHGPMWPNGSQTMLKDMPSVNKIKSLYTTPTAKPFQHIAMDFITGLPKKGDKDAILTIVNQGYSWAAIFLPCNMTITGPQIAQLYLNQVYKWFGLPKKIILDWDPCFTSHFGTVLTRKLNIKQNLSSAFHPQTDGLSEQKNQWIK